MKIDIKDLQEIFSKAFGQNVYINENTKREDLIEWDSINQLNLVIELEYFYNISLTKSEIEKLNSVRFLIELLEKK